MKINDMHEVHTSTIVSFWQLIVGFLFLPMLRFQALGGLSKYDEYCIVLYCIVLYEPLLRFSWCYVLTV